MNFGVKWKATEATRQGRKKYFSEVSSEGRCSEVHLTEVIVFVLPLSYQNCDRAGFNSV